MNKKRVAVVGYGGMGSWHVNKLLVSDVAELAGIFDISEERKELAIKNGLHAYSSLDEVLADERVDIITVATPNDHHMPIAIKAMEAGKNVICEKPVCMNSDELQKIIDASNRTGKLFTVHQNRRWDCDYLAMKDVYKSSELGEIFRVESRYHGSRGIPGDWRGHKEFGGGMMLDWGVHLIDQMLGIVYDSKVKSLYCKCEHITNYEVDDGFKLDLYFENGVTARIEVSTSNFISLPRLYMLGTNGSAIIRSWHTDCEIVCCKNWDEKDVVPVVTAAGLTKTMAPRDEKTITKSEIPLPTSDVHDFYRNVCKAVDGIEPQIVTHAQVMRVMKIMEAAFESDRLGQVIEIEDHLV